MIKSMNFTELAKIININSYSKNKCGVDQNAEVFKSWMLPLGFQSQTYERALIGNHILFKSNKKPGKKILLLGHLDTVYPPGTFEKFSEDDDWIYGPGVCDMKGGNYVALCALRNLKQQTGEIVNIDMLLVSDEETGSDDSKTLSSQLAKNYDYCFVFEAAGKNHEVVLSRKGVATFNIKIEGKAAHAGNEYSNGINANLAAAHMIIDLTALTDLTQETTVNVGKCSGGVGANTISPKANLVVEARFNCFDEKLRVLENIYHIVDHAKVEGVKISITGGVQRDVMSPTLKQEELLNFINSAIGYTLPTESRGGVSDANTMSEAGLITIDGFGPFGDGDHTTNERACKNSFIRRIDEMSKILFQYTKQNSNKYVETSMKKARFA
ncbi:peptidase M20 [Pseudoalteromonas sp. NBT06-2]|uniref:M20 family metallopeptidase n=1 Tax=Pseudoalteromonas sp. NBT06-2 TaxID=2025950 RepID=UPI000BA654F4|nr:M20 family metallopeptidase [Pseudoalteromonas sp. NBT06-2]PAJ72949.1 peptidase M20 [Pseudoalteromonas sp. NBT06-2]